MGIHEKNFNFKKSLLTNLFIFSGKKCEALDIKYIDSEVKSYVRLILYGKQNHADYGSSSTHLARGSPNVKKNTHPVFQHISHLWYILMMTHCVGTSNSGGILIFSLSFSKYC